MYPGDPLLKIYPDFPESSGAWRMEGSYFPPIKDSTIWNKAFNFPTTGVKMSFIDLGNPILGKAMSLQYMFLKTIRLHHRFDINWGIGLGMVYFTNPYDFLDNEENIASGSHWAFLPEVKAGITYHLDEHYSILSAFNLYHSSNGHTQLPNVGINVPALQLGIKYHWNKPNYSKEVSIDDKWNKKWQLNSRFSLGMNEFGGSTSPTNGPKQLIYLSSLYLSKRYSPKGRYQLGFDGYYNSGYRNYLISQEPEELNDRFIDASVLLVFIGHEYIYGHYGLVVQAGYYLHNPFLSYFIEKDKSADSGSLKAKVPGKFGVHYYIWNPYNEPKNNAYIGMYIKSNVTQADFLELGVGFQF